MSHNGGEAELHVVPSHTRREPSGKRSFQFA